MLLLTRHTTNPQMPCWRFLRYLLLLCAFCGGGCGDPARASVLPLRGFRQRIGMFLSDRVHAYQEVIYKITNTTCVVRKGESPPWPWWLGSF